jgi:hypothetical protein
MRALATAMLVGFAACAPTAPAWGQQSASYGAREHAFNAGGHPAGGTVLASSGYRVTLDAVGDRVGGRSLGSASFHVDGGFATAYPPPGEVLDLRFADRVTMRWAPDRSVGSYAVYRDLTSMLPASGYGYCHQHGLTDATATTGDSPVPGDGWFYLVTARNRLGEEGTKGRRSNGAERGNPTACP